MLASPQAEMRSPFLSSLLNARISCERGHCKSAPDNNGPLDWPAELSLRQSWIVELRFFGELTVNETAEVLRIAPRTVKQDWSVARAWLHREISTRAVSS